MNILAKILFSKIGADILRLLIGSIDTDMPLREMEKRTGIPVETLRAELKKLAELNLVSIKRDGNRFYVKANTDHPDFPDIRSVVQKTISLAGELKRRRT